MSAEFGGGTTHFFHDKIREAAEDCKVLDSHNITKMWGKFLDELYEIAYNISMYEAGDIGIEHCATEQIAHIKKLKKQLDLLETGHKWVQTKSRKGK